MSEQLLDDAWFVTFDDGSAVWIVQMGDRLVVLG